ncbi:beta-lactamase family protein [Thalassospira sp. MA62]|nr:beta-lactamase family protein [Thalassospira sp. MA62]
MHWIKTLFIGTIMIVLGLIAVFFIWLAPVGAAYSAKMMCSTIFVSGLPSTRARDEDVLSDNNILLSLITTNVDLRNGTVSAHAFGFRTRVAVYRPKLGCTLTTDPDEIASLSSASPIIRPIEAKPLVTAALPEDVQRRRLTNLLFDVMDEPGLKPQRRTRAVVVLHRGKVIGERYADGIGADTPLPGWSMTKSVFNALLGGMRLRDGIPDIDGPVLINEWHANPNDPRATITYDDLLRMRSGLEFDESYWNPFSDVVQMLYADPGAAGFAVSKPLENPPGTKFSYSSGATNILSAAMRNLSGSRQNYLRLPTEVLFRPLGITNAVIETDHDGYFVGSSYMYATARDWAKIGQLYLQDGVWDGERILPEGWVDYATSAPDADPDSIYGAHWWRDIPGGHDTENDQSAPTVPDDAFFALGHDGQSISVIPSRDLVVVRLGLTRKSDAFDLRRFIAELSNIFPVHRDDEQPAVDGPETTAPVDGQ